jgi:hypothetical protein
MDIPLFFSNLKYSWFQIFTVFWMLYPFFWVIPRRLNFICRRFGTLLRLHSRLWRWNIQSGPKRRHIKFRRRGITHKKAYNNLNYFATYLVRKDIRNSNILCNFKVIEQPLCKKLKSLFSLSSHLAALLKCSLWYCICQFCLFWISLFNYKLVCIFTNIQH